MSRLLSRLLETTFRRGDTNGGSVSMSEYLESSTPKWSEKHYTVNELAETFAISTDKVRRIFQNESGVLKFGEPSRRMGRVLKRRYYTLRIPESVVKRVLARIKK